MIYDNAFTLFLASLNLEELKSTYEFGSIRRIVSFKENYDLRYEYDNICCDECKLVVTWKYFYIVFS